MALERVGVVIPAKNEPGISDGSFLKEVLDCVPPKFDPTIYLVVSGATDDFTQLARESALKNPHVRLLLPEPGLARAYLAGYAEAINKGAGLIIEMDANGSHKPEYIPNFLDPLQNGKTAALSTRFSQGGSVERYPLQRRLISRTGTILANLTLGLGQYVSDMTSGYEAFDAELIGNILSSRPIDDWISVRRGPGHFIQTEIRTLAIWRGAEVEMVPITWGSERTQDPVKLPLRTVLKAFFSLLELRKSRNQLISGNLTITKAF